MIEGNLFINLSIILVISLLIAGIFRILKQPVIIGYIVAGVIISPYFLNLLGNSTEISTLTKIGEVILLFMVGLSLNLKSTKKFGKVSLITGIGQIIFTIIIAFFAGKLLGFSAISSLYIGIAISFSSTIIIMKILSDKGETETLYGRISIGFLIVQDIIAIIVLMIISSFNGGNELTNVALQKLGMGASLIAGLAILTIFVLPKITKPIAKSQELLLLFSISWALAIASLFSFTGFSVEIGALLAGISLTLSPYKYEMSAKLKPMRDFFLLIFFITIGTQIDLPNIGSIIVPTIVFSIIVLIGNPIIILSLMGFLGYTKRNSFLAGLTVSQISEFSFILIALGIQLGHLPPNIIHMIALIGLITMGGCTYLIANGNRLYNLLSSPLSLFERKIGRIDEMKRFEHEKYDIILLGYNRIGYSLLKEFKKLHKKALVVDYNPDTISQLFKEKIDCIYGDVGDIDFLNDLPLKEASIIISTIPDLETNLIIIEKVREQDKSVDIVTVAHQIEDALDMYKAGATYVITPHFLGGDYVSHLIEESQKNEDRLKEEGNKHKKEMLERQKQGHELPVHDRD